VADDSTPSGVTIERDVHSQQFVTVHNRVARDKRLHRSSRGLLIEILSLPPNTRVKFDTLAANGPEKRDALRTMIQELEKFGYVTIIRTRDKQGHFWTRYIFRETPASQGGPAASENPHWTLPAETPSNTHETAGQDQCGFPASGNPSVKSFKDVPEKDIKDGGDALPGDDPPAVGDPLSRMIIGEIKSLTGADITADHAAAIGVRLLAQRAEPPEHPVEWTRAVLRATSNPRGLLPTPTPPRFTAPPPAPAPRPESIQAARAAIAHLVPKRPTGTGDPLRDLAAEQLAELRASRAANDPEPPNPDEAAALCPDSATQHTQKEPA
jgi:hypothetical protein